MVRLRAAYAEFGRALGVPPGAIHCVHLHCCHGSLLQCHPHDATALTSTVGYDPALADDLVALIHQPHHSASHIANHLVALIAASHTTAWQTVQHAHQAARPCARLPGEGLVQRLKAQASSPFRSTASPEFAWIIESKPFGTAWHAALVRALVGQPFEHFVPSSK